MIKEIKRCNWAERNPVLQKYHDTVWGIPEFNERRLFAALSLEIIQAGLRWDMILKKRAAIYRAFDNFNYRLIASYSNLKLKALLNDASIIRNRSKLASVIYNAKRLSSLHQTGLTLKDLTWRLVNYSPLDHLKRSRNDGSDYSRFIKPYLITFKYYSFKRVGPKTLYSYLQAVGVVNDHLLSCFRHEQISRMVR